jgi:hypothetical protein
MRIGTLAAATTLAAIGFSTSPTVAQVGGIATVATAGVVGSKLIQQFEDTSNMLLMNAGQHGDIFETKMGDEMRVATENLKLALGDEQDAIFENLSPPLQQAFLSLNQMVDAVNQATSKAVSIAEVANLDLIEFTNRLPLTTKVDFYVSSVRGLTQSYSDGDYQLNIRGLGFGFSPSGRKYGVKLTFGEVEVPADKIEAVGANETRVTLPHDMLERMFDPGKTNIVKARVDVSLVKDTCFLFVFPDHDAAQYRMDLSVALLPKFPGALTGTEPLKTMALDPVIRTTSVVHPYPAGACHSDKPCDWSSTVQLAEDEYAVGVRYQCVGQCGWDYNLRHGGYAPDFDILEDGHKVVVYRHNDGDHATTATYYVDYHKMVPQFAQSPIGPMPIAFNQTFFVDLKPQNVDCSYAVTAKLVTKQTPYLDSGMGASADHLLVKQSVSRMGDHCRISLTLDQP